MPGPVYTDVDRSSLKPPLLEPARLSPGAAIAVGATGLLGYLGGWLIIVDGGFHHAATRYSRETVFVDGLAALAMAAIFFALSGVAAVALLRSRRVAGWKCSLVVLGLMIPPLAYSLVR